MACIFVNGGAKLNGLLDFASLRELLIFSSSASDGSILLNSRLALFLGGSLLKFLRILSGTAGLAGPLDGETASDFDFSSLSASCSLILCTKVLNNRADALCAFKVLPLVRSESFAELTLRATASFDLTYLSKSMCYSTCLYTLASIGAS